MATEEEMTPEKFAALTGADPGTFRPLKTPDVPGLEFPPGMEVYSWDIQGVDHVLGHATGRPWMWGPEADKRHPLLQADSLDRLAAFYKVTESRVAFGVEKFGDASEETLDMMFEMLGTPEKVRQNVGSPSDPEDVTVCTAGVARMTVMRIRARRATEAKRRSMN